MLKNFYSKMTIRLKLLVFILLPSIIAVAGIVYLQSHRSLKQQEAISKKYAKELGQSYSLKIQNDLNLAMESAKNIARIFGQPKNFEISKRREIFSNILKSLIEQNPNFVSVWGVWEKNGIDGNDKSYINSPNCTDEGRFMPTWYRTTNGSIAIGTADLLESELTNQDYYKLSFSTKKEVILDPYFYSYTSSKTDSILETTVIAPIYSDGVFIGTVGIDYSLDYFIKNISTYKPEGEGYVFLVSNKGVFVSHPKKELINRNISEIDSEFNGQHNVMQRIRNGEELDFVKKSSLNGKISETLFMPITVSSTTTPWSVGISIPQDSFYKDINDVKTFSLVLAFISMLITGLFILFITSGINQNIRMFINKISDAINSTIDGKLDYRINSENINFEFQSIGKKLNLLLDSFVKPINLTAEYIDRISKGDIPPKITDPAKGDFQEINNNFNNCIDNLINLENQVRYLKENAENQRFDVQCSTENLTGIWDEILSSGNSMLQVTNNYLEIIKISEEKFRVAFELANSGVALLATDGSFIQSNAYLRQMLGYSDSEFVDMSLYDIMIPDDNENSGNMFLDLLNQKIDSFQIERSFFNKNKNIVYSLLSLSTYKSNGEIEFLIAQFVDITERKKAENEVQKLNKEFENRVIQRTKELNSTLEQLETVNEELKQLNLAVSDDARKLLELNDRLTDSEQKLIEANGAKDKFFSIIAHDLKNPISSIMLGMDLLDMYYEEFDKETVKDHIVKLKDASNSLYRLLEDLLQWARSQTGKIEYNPEYYDIESIIENTVSLTNLMADAKEITIETHYPKALQVFCDIQLIDTVLRNLCSNSIKFSSRKNKIEIKIKENFDSIEFEVKDYGVGMDEKIIANLFKIDKNTSNKGTENESGTGLGLFLCNEFIHKHNGEIKVLSEIGKGSSFIFTLPKKI